MKADRALLQKGHAVAAPQEPGVVSQPSGPLTGKTNKLGAGVMSRTDI
jgi:hypothetical protein